MFKIIAILSLFFTITSYAQVHRFETSRLKSTGGAGVASLLMTESAFLNPASIGFFNFSTISFQKDKYNLQDANTSRPETESEFDDNSGNWAITASDAQSNLKGTLAYINQTEGYAKRKRISASFAAPIAQVSSMGISLHRSWDKWTGPNNNSEDDYYLLSIGVLHAIGKQITLGLVLDDPFKSGPESTRFTAGIQYLFFTSLTAIFDAGTNYSYDDIGEALFYRAAIQSQFLGNLYLRAGVFVDKGMGERGNGYGISWAGPRLMLDLSFKYSKAMTSSAEKLWENEKLRETSLGITLQF